MSVRRVLSLLAALALLSPLVATAAPLCAPGQHCPMAGVTGGSPPCHGMAIRAADCCLTTATTEAVQVVPLIAAMAPGAADTVPAPWLDLGEGAPAPPPAEAPSTPLYRLFRALLI